MFKVGKLYTVVLENSLCLYTFRALDPEEDKCSPKMPMPGFLVGELIMVLGFAQENEVSLVKCLREDSSVAFLRMCGGSQRLHEIFKEAKSQ